MIVAGLDTGTTSGIGILSGRELLHASSFRPKGDEDAEIFHGFRIWWRAMLVSHGVEAAAIEEPLRTDLVGSFESEDDEPEMQHFASRPKIKRPIGNMRTFLRLYGIRAHAIEVCESLCIPCVEVNNRTWRSAIYGAVRPPATTPASKRTEWWKKQALYHCNTILKWPIKSKDAAEGALIGDWRAAMLRPRPVTGDLFSSERATA